MKFYHYFLISILFLVSCSTEKQEIAVQDLSISDFPQTWKLVKMTGSMEGYEVTGEEMSWQENYVFREDASFLKTRNTNGESISESGKYIYKEEEQAFLLTYNQPGSITGNCSSRDTEYLFFSDNTGNLFSNWWACDGPGLIYKRIK